MRRSGLIGLALLTLSGCSRDIPEETRIAFSMSDIMMERCIFREVKTERVQNELRLFGKITADNNKISQVYPIVSGVVQSIHVELGDYVKQGQVLATIRSGEVAEFRKQRLNALNEVTVAEKNLQVARDMHSGKLNSEKDVTIAERELEQAKAELARINEVYTIYNLTDGSMYNVTAPIGGFVISKKINQNEQIRADVAEPLFAIADINEVWVMANVHESNIAKVRTGYDVSVKTLAFPDIAYTSKIDKIFNAIDPETKSMKALVRIANPDFRLKPEMNCTVSVTYSEPDSMIAVPSSALIFDKSRYYAMVFRDRHNIETRQVDLYRQVGDITYVRGGLNDGETIIAENGLLIYDALND